MNSATPNRAPPPLVRILVLAAGHSRRLGRPKALALLHGKTLLRRTVALLTPLAGGVLPALFVVVPPRAARYRAELRGLPAVMIANRERDTGLASSVRIGLRRARCSRAVLLLPVDLAGLELRDVARLVRRWRAAPRLVTARSAGGRPVTPLILPKGWFAAAAAARGDTGLREFAARLPAGAVRLVAMPSAACDVDTPADLARARAQRTSR